MKKFLPIILLLLCCALLMVASAEDEEFGSGALTIDEILPAAEAWGMSADDFQSAYPGSYSTATVGKSDALVQEDIEVEGFAMNGYFVFADGKLSKVAYIVSDDSDKSTMKAYASELVDAMANALGIAGTDGKSVTEWFDGSIQIGTAKLKNYTGNDDLRACIILKKGDYAAESVAEEAPAEQAAEPAQSQGDFHLNEEAVIVNQEGVTITLTGNSKKMGSLLMLEAVVENNSAEAISVSVDSLSINGWEVYTMGITDIGAGKKKKGSFDMNLSNASIESADEIEDIEITLKIIHPDDHYKTAFVAGPIVITK